jgi:hypothetical protein
VIALLVCDVAHAEPSAIDELAKECARIRGLRLKKPIAHEVIARDELRRRLRARAEEATTKARLAADGFALARWGLIPLPLDYEATLVEILTEQISGYYDPATSKLALTEPTDDLVLAHELGHGLQDQAFDLTAFENVPETEPDAALARRALVEGDGTALMIEVMLARDGQAAPWSSPRVAAALERSMGQAGGGSAFDRAPLAVREALLFPYRAGTSFVAELRRRQPWSAVDAAYKRPPRSTEQILHVDRYLASEAPVVVTLQAPSSLPGYSLVHDGVWGEHGFAVFLQAHGLDAGVAANAAEGWGGDRVWTFARDADRRPERGVGIGRFVWDSEADALEATEAAAQALDRTHAGAMLARAADDTRWMSIDGRVSWVERRGTQLVIVVGAPAWAVAGLAADAWR